VEPSSEMAKDYGIPSKTRTHSLPSKYLIPSVDMGRYESPTRRKSAPDRENPTSKFLI